MTRLHGSALRVTIFVGEGDTFHHNPPTASSSTALVADGPVILDECEVIRYAGRHKEGRAR